MTTQKELASVLSVGKLVDFEWKLGVAMTSSQCSPLTVPFVSVLLKVADDNNVTILHSFELTLPEFTKFAKNFNDIATILDSLEY